MIWLENDLLHGIFKRHFHTGAQHCGSIIVEAVVAVLDNVMILLDFG